MEELAQLEEEVKKLEELEKKIDSGEIDLASPNAVEKDSLPKLYREILDREDSTKTANLSDAEINSVSILQNAALFAESQGLDIVSRYFQLKAEIRLSLSMSKKMKFMELMVTQIKKTLGLSPSSAATPTRWWQSKSKEQEEQ